MQIDCCIKLMVFMPFFLDDALKFIMNSSHINFKFKILHVIEFMSKTKSNHFTFECYFDDNS